MPYYVERKTSSERYVQISVIKQIGPEIQQFEIGRKIHMKTMKSKHVDLFLKDLITLNVYNIWSFLFQAWEDVA